MSSATEFMDCSLGAVSPRIRPLERQAEEGRFDRMRRRVELTRPGRNLPPAVREPVDMHDRLQRQIGTGNASGSARPGVAESPESQLAAPKPGRCQLIIGLS